MSELSGDKKIPRFSIFGPDGSTPRTSASVRRISQAAANWLQWVQDRLNEVTGTFQLASGADPTTDLVTSYSHGYSANDPVRFVVGVDGTIPTGITPGVIYYVKTPATDTFKLSATPGGSAIDITGAGAGEVYVVKVASPEIYLPASGDIRAGKLSAVLGALLAMCGRIDAGVSNSWESLNAFVEKVTFSGGLEVASDQLAAILGTLALARAPLYVLGTAADADSTIDVSKPIWNLAAASVLRADTLRSSTEPIPLNGQVIEVHMAQGGAAARRLVREDSTVVATLGNDASDPAHCKVIYRGGLWRLHSYGAHVTPGTGA